MNEGGWGVSRFQSETEKGGKVIFFEAQPDFRACLQCLCQDKGCCAPWCQTGSQHRSLPRRPEAREPRAPAGKVHGSGGCLLFRSLRELKLKSSLLSRLWSLNRDSAGEREGFCCCFRCNLGQQDNDCLEVAW